jgi:hypothetical protein
MSHGPQLGVVHHGPAMGTDRALVGIRALGRLWALKAHSGVLERERCQRQTSPTTSTPTTQVESSRR